MLNLSFKTVSILVFALFFVSGTYIITKAQAKQEQKENLTLDSIKNKKGAVILHHKAHTEKYGAKCMDCHHDIKKDTDEKKACKKCHEADKEKDKAPKLEKAYHDRCKTCHKKAVDARKAKNEKFDMIPAVKCDGCHQK